MSEWRETSFENVVFLVTGYPFNSSSYTNIIDDVKLLRGDNIIQGALRWEGVKYWPKGDTTIEQKYNLLSGDVVLAMDRPWIEAGLKYSVVKKSDLPCYLVQRVACLRAKDEVDTNFLRYVVASSDFTRHILSVETGTAVPHISGSQILEYSFLIPPLPEQRAIASVLSSLDDKIDLLHRQNKTLEDMAETLFRQWFVEEADEGWEEGKLNQYVDIGIGRTPPRQEHEWFSENRTDIKWISIKDLGNDGTYIFNTAEYLTHKAVNRFNIPVIPANTVVLSFKMTVGRVAITTEEMLTNEAIAHFKIKNDTPFSVEYLYFFLKIYRYDSLGSTSSIVTAINSAMIKNMSIIIPGKKKMNQFSIVVKILFEKIKTNQIQIRTLEKLRDTLLPKLMSGEVRVDV